MICAQTCEKVIILNSKFYLQLSTARRLLLPLQMAIEAWRGWRTGKRELMHVLNASLVNSKVLLYVSVEKKSKKCWLDFRNI